MNAPGATSRAAGAWGAIPVFNNAATVRDAAAGARQQLARVIVVDDGSTDGRVAELLADLDVTVLTHPRNLGKGAALLTAMRHAAQRGAEYLVTLDGDGQHFPQDIARFLGRLEPKVMLIGDRAEVLGRMPPSSRFGRAFSDFWIRVETGAAVRDTQSGFRAYPLAAILKLPLGSRGYPFEVEVVTRALWAGLRVEKVPIRVWYADAASRISSFRPLWDNLRIALLHARLVLRQALPIPHRRVVEARAATDQERRDGPGVLRRFLVEHATPLGLAAAAALGLLTAALPWVLPRLLLLIYLALRWRLNQPLALALHALGLLPAIPLACVVVGELLLRGRIDDLTAATTWWSRSPPLWREWLVGSMVVGPALAAAAGVVVYHAARRLGLGDDSPAAGTSPATSPVTPSPGSSADEHR